MATQLGPESNPAATPTQVPRLLDQLFIALHAANYGPKNAQRLVEWCRQFILFHGKRHPRELGAADVQRFLDHLVSNSGWRWRGSGKPPRRWRFFIGRSWV